MKNPFYSLSRTNLLPFLRAIIKKNISVIAPVKKECVRFEIIKEPKEIHLKSNSYFPLKEFFFRKKEPIFEYKNNSIKECAFQQQTRVFFGIRRCDLNAIYHQDMVFLKSHFKDAYYDRARKNSILIGYHCVKAPSKYCFCGSLKLIDFYDVMFFERKNEYLVHVGSKEGALFLKPYLKFFKKISYKLTEKDKNIPHTDKVKKEDITKYYDNPLWEKGANLCLSCSACTTLCPTCYCHEIYDEPSIKDLGNSGVRLRNWSSCQLKSFSRVAGNHIFRDKRIDRFKHRIYHQLQYFKEKNGVHLCVGCGRCISGCPKRIDFVSLINKMK